MPVLVLGYALVLSYYFDFRGVEILQLSKIIKVQAKK